MISLSIILLQKTHEGIVLGDVFYGLLYGVLVYVPPVVLFLFSLIKTRHGDEPPSLTRFQTPLKKIHLRNKGAFF